MIIIYWWLVIQLSQIHSYMCMLYWCIGITCSQIVKVKTEYISKFVVTEKEKNVWIKTICE